MRRSLLLVAFLAAVAAGVPDTARAQTNANPVITAPATVSAAIGTLVSVTASASDPDAEDVTLSQTNNVPYFTPSSSSAGPSPNPNITLSGTPGPGQCGSFTIQWSAADSHIPAGTGQATTTVSILASCQSPPVVTAPATVSGAENNAVTISASATDGDANAVTLSQTNNAPFLAGPASAGPALNPSITLAGTPNFSQAGSYTITWTAVDNGSPPLNSQATTSLAIANVNRNPVITAPAVVSGQENAFISITGSATDPDAQNVTLSQTNNAPFLAGSASAGPALNPSITLSGTPNFTQSGSYSIQWTAVDSNSPAGSATATTAVTIGGPDRAPVIFVASTANGTEGVPFSISASSADPDGQNVTLCVNSVPAFLLGPSCVGPAPNPSLTLSGTPGPSDAGSYVINWSATDSGTGSAAAATAITIANSNSTPVLNQPFNMTVDEGAVATQQLTASDPEGDPLIFFKVGTSPFFMSVSTGGLVTLSPGFSDAGNYTATVRVSDGETTDQKSFAIAVVNVNRCPTADAGGPYLGVRTAAVAFDGTGSLDPDGDALTYAWDFGDGMTGSGATTSHVYAVAGIYTVTLTVSDGTCPATDTTTADIDNEFGATAFTTGGNGTVSLGSGKPFNCAQVEPLGGAFDVADVDLGSIKMVSEGTGAVSEIPAAVGKTTIVDDKNGNGVDEIRSCFAKADLRELFSLLPAGRNDVTVFIDGALTSGGTFRASLALTVKATGGALAASISPNPLNPSARLTFGTTKPGSVRVQLFDLNGRLVRTVLDERQSAAGYHDVMIDGRTATGGRVPSGVYFVKIWTEHEGSITKSLTILK